MVVSIGIWHISCLGNVAQCRNSTISLVNCSSGGYNLCKLAKIMGRVVDSDCGTVTDLKLIMPRFQGVRGVPDDA